MNFELNEVETKRANIFKNKHYRKHKADRRAITFFPTGIGNCVTIQCLICCEKKDITDTSDW